MIKRILIVDDSAIARKMMRSCIPKDQGYEFTEASNGDEGVKLFTEFRPDVTFLDITMPVMDGITCLEAIKKIDESSVVVMCTADVQPKSVLKVTGLGALMVVKKPPTKEGILDVLNKVNKMLEETESGTP